MIAIKKPTLLLDEQKCRANIQKMIGKAQRNGCTLRPHFKTHQSYHIGRWFRETGIDKITVSSLSMATYFAEDGWANITVAFPVNILEMQTIRNLAAKIQLNLLVESVEAVEQLKKHLHSPVQIFIKTDTGYGRTGINFKNVDAFREILAVIEKAGMLQFSGFLAHAGHSYTCRSLPEVQTVHEKSIASMLELKAQFSGQYPDLICSVGDTPTCSLLEDFRAVDELRPGNFIFYDYTQQVIGSCSTDEIAVAMACPVVAIHPDRNELVIYGGTVHFASDSVTNASGQTIFGQLVENTGTGWGTVVPDAFVKKLSQEHGIVQATSDFIQQASIGDIVKILPVHSCTTANLAKQYLSINGNFISRL